MAKVVKRRFDPERRSRIIDSTLDIIAERGVAGTTHRRVAEAADVPLGSMTYHFTDLQELLDHAFTRLAEQVSQRCVDLLDAANSKDEARHAIVEIIMRMSSRDLLLSYELYAYAARHPALIRVMQEWMRRSSEAIERHFDPGTARVLDAFIEGMAIHQSVDPYPGGREALSDVVLRLTGSMPDPCLN